MRKPFWLSRCLIAVVALTAFGLPCWAQGNLRTVLFVKLKVDQVDNWKAAVKDYAALVKKAGSEQAYTVWESRLVHPSMRSCGTQPSGKMSGKTIPS